MEKIKIEDMACFEQVAKVIGVADAKRELFIAVNGYDNEDYPIEMRRNLVWVFYWDDTPQRHGFWDAINDGINPLQPIKLAP